MKSILLIDNDLDNKRLIGNYLSKKDYDVETVEDSKSALKNVVEKNFGLIISNLDVEKKDKLFFLKDLIEKVKDTPVIAMCENNNPEFAVDLIKNGAEDILLKPLNHEDLKQKVSEVISAKEEKVEADFIRGKSPVMNDLYSYIKKVAETDVSILLQGETGVGKEVIARHIHNLSDRHNKPFVAVDCGAIPTELADSEFFGHVKGAFTGAIKDKMGAFEEANGGTLFLDEIGNLQYNLQIKLLRALQERIITRVGAFNEIKVDIRVISATNEDIFTLIDENNFREDLFHRINEFRLNVPPLRSRVEDIKVLSDYFFNKFNKRFNKKTEGFDKDAFEIIQQYSWPGNIRELSNVIKRAVLLSETNFIDKKSLPKEIFDTNTKTDNIEETRKKIIKSEIKQGQSLKDISSEAEKYAIDFALEFSNDNKSEAAKILKIDRKTLYNKIDDLDLNDEGEDE